MVDASTLERGVSAVYCPACDELARQVDVLIVDRYGFEWDLATCHRCGLQWQIDPLTDDARKHFYGSGLYRQLCEQVTGKPWTDRQYLEDAQMAYASKWVNWIDLQCKRVLDFGGSTGLVSSILTCGSDDVIVADYGDGATTTPEEALTQGPYDAVLCCQTLDHLPNPLEMLRTFRDITTDGGTLFVDVVKNAPKKIDHDLYFTSATCFIGLVERAGWIVDWLDAETNPTHWTIGAHK